MLPTAPGAPNVLTMPEIQAMPPITAYCTSSTEPTTPYWPKPTFVCRNDSSTPPVAAMPGGDGEGVELDADDADAERRGGALVAADRQESGTDPPSPQVGDDEPDDDEHEEHEPAVALRMVDGIEVDAEDATPG